METIKVNPWGDGQGDFVVICASDFDPKTHTLYGAEEELEPELEPEPKPKAKQK